MSTCGGAPQETSGPEATFSVAFIGEAVTDADGIPVEKVHALYQIRERDDHALLIEDVEFHFINMKSFAKEINAGAGNGIESESFRNWLMLLTMKDIDDKGKLSALLDEEEEMMSAMETLSNLSQDKVKRQAYQRRLDEINSYNHMIAENLHMNESELTALLGENATD